MIRKVATGLLLAAALGGAFSPAHAAPSSFTVSGSIANSCSIAATSVGLTVSRSGSVTVTASPISVAARCNGANGGTLSVSSTRLQNSASPGTFQDYTLSVAGWGTAMTYTTAASPPAATTKSSAAPIDVTLTFSCSAGCTSGTIANNSSWTATITLGLAANP